MFWNSVKITVGFLAGQILVGVPAAWGFARYRFPGKNLLFMIYVALMMMPFQVMMLSNYPVSYTHLGIPRILACAVFCDEITGSCHNKNDDADDQSREKSHLNMKSAKHEIFTPL